MKRLSDGGSAFPRLTHDAWAEHGYCGMTLRDYFIAHAPEEPQHWFAPVMPPKPVVPDWRETKGDLREDLQQWWDMGLAATDEGRAWIATYNKLSESLRDWERERLKQTYIQWPAAWADAMLAERERVQ